MPYVDTISRKEFDPLLNQLVQASEGMKHYWQHVFVELGTGLLKANLPDYFDRVELKLGEAYSPVYELIQKLGSVSGNYNYAYTYLAHAYLKEYGLRYEHINTLMGILHLASVKVHSRAKRYGGKDYEIGLFEFVGMFKCMTFEFYMTVIYPYEQKKRAENGRVSGFDNWYYQF